MIGNYINRLLSFIYYLVNFSFYNQLSVRAVIYGRVRADGKKYISIGDNTTIQRQGWLLAVKIDENDPKIKIGKYCSIGDFSHITAMRNITIEDGVLIANNVYISDNSHQYEDINTFVKDQPVIFKSEVYIKSGAWIGENVCIIGASVGRNSVIGANSVVTKDIPDYSIAVGSPARVIKRYDFSNSTWVKTNE